MNAPRYPSLSVCMAAVFSRPGLGHWALQRFRWIYRGWTAGGALPE